MKRRTFLKATGVAAAGCAGSATVVGGRNQDENTHLVEMWSEDGNYYFDPIGLYVEPGDTVRWVNEAGSHSATSYSPENPGTSKRRIPRAAEPWDSGILTQSGATFEYTFEETGTYDYFCTPHKTLGMVARIVCGEAGGIATESPIPDEADPGRVPSSEVIVEEERVSFPYTPETDGGGGTNTLQRALVLFGGVFAAAVGAYHAFNSEGESSQVGSDEWRHETGLDRRNRRGGNE